MCGSTVDIQSATAEIRRGIKKEERTRMRANALLNIGGAAVLNAAKSGSRQLLECRALTLPV